MNFKKKISLYFFLCIAVFSYSQSNDNTITISFDNIPLSEAIQRIEKVCSFTFFYDALKIDLKQKVSLNAKKTPIKKAITDLLANTTINFEITNSQIAIFQIKKNAEPQITNKTKIVSGVVIDEKGQPVIGASVIIPGTTIGVATDINGRFKLEAPSNAKLRITYIGYDAKEELLNTSDDLKIKLEPTPQALKELVITAQAIGQKNAILQQINSNTIKNVVAADRLQENPDANAVEAIGRLPGISLQRSGGEGTGLVVRGLEQRYTAITLNGIELPAISGGDRSTNLNSISQYALQGAEVFKSLTADMDANSVAGAVNLKVRGAPNGFKSNIMLQGGYNMLNNYFGNYKVAYDFSNRFFNKKLGILITVNAERVNRSVQTMSSSYNIESADPNADILLNNTNLNLNTTFIYRQSVLFSTDYKLNENTSFTLYSIYNRSKNDNQNQSKNYSLNGAGGVGYTFSSNPNTNIDMFQTTFSGETKINFLKIKADYGLSFSSGNNTNIRGRTWFFKFNNNSTSDYTDIEHRKLDPTQIVPLFSENTTNLLDCWLEQINTVDNIIKDKNYNAYVNFTLPINTEKNWFNANVKFGALFKLKSRFRNDTYGKQSMMASVNQFAPKLISESMTNLTLSSNGYITAAGLDNGKVSNFLDGQFDFGNTFNISKLNQISDTWEDISQYYYNQGPSVYLPVFGEVNKLGYQQNVEGSIMNDQDIKERYGAGYIMAEINLGKHIMFLPGVRYEKTFTNMKGMYAIPPLYSPPITSPVQGADTAATNSTEFLMPDIHLRVKPNKNSYIHFSFTKTLSRPDYNSISPNYFVNTGWAPFSYNASNPLLKPEEWTNFDAQFVLHGSKIGLLSITAFNKSVKNKIWSRQYQRIKGDQVIAPFPNTALVNVSIWENHSHKGYVNGIEFELQTAFNYLPKPFCYFTTSINYTFNNSQTTYPYTRTDYITPQGGGRPVAVRIDSVIINRMKNQPKHIANLSLGYNKSNLNVWLSFQYNGGIFTDINYRGTPRLNSTKDHFYRWDLQIAQKITIKKVKGIELIFNFANIGDFTERQKQTGGPRYTYIERYGPTLDAGLRLKL